MATVYLKSYLERIRQEYGKARAEYTRLFDSLDAASVKYQAVKRSGDYSHTGKIRAGQQFEKKSRQLRSEIEKVCSDAGTSFAEIRAEVGKLFAPAYQVTPEKLDMAALELLKSGILTDSELLEFGKRFEGNPTMTRLIGKYAKIRAEAEPENREMRRFSIVSQQASTVLPLEAVDSLTFYAGKALRPDRALSDGVASIFDENADRIVKEYGNICIETE